MEEALTTVTRFQFYVYEIARCRRKMNDWVYEDAHKDAVRVMLAAP